MGAYELIDLTSFFKRYIHESLTLAVDEYKLNSAFNNYQQGFILYKYKKELRRYGVRRLEYSYFQRSLRNDEVLEDALSMAVDISAYFVLKNESLFSRSLIEEARAVINRKDQYCYENFLLGFGYFLKSICIKGKLAIPQTIEWADEHIEEIVNGMQLTKILTERAGNNLQCIITMRFPFSVGKRQIRINSADFIKPLGTNPVIKLMGKNFPLNLNGIQSNSLRNFKIKSQGVRVIIEKI